MTQALSEWQCCHMLKQIAQAVGSVSLQPLHPLSTPLSLHPLFHPLDLSLLFSDHGAISSGAVLCIPGSGMKCVCLSEGKSHRFALALLSDFWV